MTTKTINDRMIKCGVPVLPQNDDERAKAMRKGTLTLDRYGGKALEGKGVDARVIDQQVVDEAGGVTRSIRRVFCDALQHGHGYGRNGELLDGVQPVCTRSRLKGFDAEGRRVPTKIDGEGGKVDNPDMERGAWFVCQVATGGSLVEIASVAQRKAARG